MSFMPANNTFQPLRYLVTGIAWVVLLILTICQSGCDRAIIYPGELTQTARAYTPTLPPPPSATHRPPTVTSTATSVKIPVLPSPTQSPLPPITATSQPTQPAALEPLVQASLAATDTLEPSDTPEPTDTLEPTSIYTPSITPTIDTTKNPPILYYSQSGDTLDALALRFMVNPEEISSPGEIPQPGTLIQPNQLLIIPNKNFVTGPGDRAMPDSEIINSPSSKDFNTAEYVKQAGGYLSTYRQELPEGFYSGFLL